MPNAYKLTFDSVYYKRHNDFVDKISKGHLKNVLYRASVFGMEVCIGMKVCIGIFFCV